MSALLARVVDGEWAHLADDTREHPGFYDDGDPPRPAPVCASCGDVRSHWTPAGHRCQLHDPKTRPLYLSMVNIARERQGLPPLPDNFDYERTNPC